MDISKLINNEHIKASYLYYTSDGVPYTIHMIEPEILSIREMSATLTILDYRTHTTIRVPNKGSLKNWDLAIEMALSML